MIDCSIIRPSAIPSSSYRPIRLDEPNNSAWQLIQARSFGSWRFSWTFEWLIRAPLMRMIAISISVSHSVIIISLRMREQQRAHHPHSITYPREAALSRFISTSRIYLRPREIDAIVHDEWNIRHHRESVITLLFTRWLSPSIQLLHMKFVIQGERIFWWTWGYLPGDNATTALPATGKGGARLITNTLQAKA